MSAIRAMTGADWPRVEEIYRQGIDDGEATFEATVPTWETFDDGKLRAPRLVTIDANGMVIGWAAASPVSARDVYRGVIEHSIYIDRAARGRRLGRELLQTLVESADRAGFWMIQASIFPENIATVRLHQSTGFRVVGTRERIAKSTLGRRAGTWRDTVLIERRSTRNGVG